MAVVGEMHDKRSRSVRRVKGFELRIVGQMGHEQTRSLRKNEGLILRFA